MDEPNKPRRRKRVNSKQIFKEMADIAFSETEKTSDRLRALDRLSEIIDSGKKEEKALQKLDEILKSIGN